MHPIDNAIHALMNMSLRPVMRRYVCGEGQGALAGLQICEECAAAEGEKLASCNQTVEVRVAGVDNGCALQPAKAHKTAAPEGVTSGLQHARRQGSEAFRPERGQLGFGLLLSDTCTRTAWGSPFIHYP